jgi:hypothetical protein
MSLVCFPLAWRMLCSLGCRGVGGPGRFCGWRNIGCRISVQTVSFCILSSCAFWYSGISGRALSLWFWSVSFLSFPSRAFFLLGIFVGILWCVAKACCGQL